MLYMVDNLLSFVNWLNGVMVEKNITQADIAKTGFVTRSAVSSLFTNRVKSIGVDMCRAVSAASGIPLEAVYRKAGLLPQLPNSDILSEEILHVVGQMYPDEKQEILDLARVKVARHGKRTPNIAG